MQEETNKPAKNTFGLLQDPKLCFAFISIMLAALLGAQTNKLDFLLAI